ncbi:hypothetical protein HNV10_03870 [Winogradskyella litoriviva]|uniref:Uncharacterized protein n=1 Tax=Winogradskyella litoriviva TaxID=1220182 RepID=A0ABX2E1K3_9FLAO|nr:hypothetical protein [Winogradskyella litoriviva]NRD22364.1 hypothetical protein [Winogradskyella litoriviva]
MNSESKAELKKQEKTIQKSLALVFIPIFIIIISISIIQNKSESHLEKEYKEIRNNSYSGKITSLLNKTQGRTRPILIDNKWQKEIPLFIHKKLNVGDSLYKKIDSDFEYYIINSKTDTIKRDVNKFYRKKYFEKLNGK